MSELTECCSCHQPKECFSLRQGVSRCADCICEKAGSSLMDLFKKGIKSISCGYIHVLVAISGGFSSMFALDVLAKHLIPNMNGKTTIVKKLEAITSVPNFDLKSKFSQSPDSDLTQNVVVHEIPDFKITAIAEFAKSNDFNCIILADNVDRISLANLAVLSCGRPDFACWISSNDFTNFSPVSILRPVRQILSTEAAFYCKHKKIEVDDSDSKLKMAFSNEGNMLKEIVDDGNKSISFAVQKLGEKLVPFNQPGKCPSCGLPGPNNEICAFCSAIENCSKTESKE